jgi:hypothetical protein
MENVAEFRYLETNRTAFTDNLKAKYIRETLAATKFANVVFPSKNLKAEMHKTIILPVVLYGCETWSLALREEHRLRLKTRC